MRNLCFTEKSLQFSRLRISPWGIPSVLLLCSSLSWRLLFLPHRRQLHPNASFLPLSLSSTRQRRRARAGAAAAVGRAAPGERRRARAGAARLGRCKRRRAGAGGGRLRLASGGAARRRLRLVGGARWRAGRLAE
jgi:hypothetical protein